MNDNLNANQNLNQALCDAYLICPVCQREKSLKLEERLVSCIYCKAKYKMRFGIPALIREDEMGINCREFLSGQFMVRDAGNIRAQKMPLIIFSQRVISEIVYFLTVLYFIFKFGFRAIFRKNWCPRDREGALLRLEKLF